MGVGAHLENLFSGICLLFWPMFSTYRRIFVLENNSNITEARIVQARDCNLSSCLGRALFDSSAFCPPAAERATMIEFFTHLTPSEGVNRETEEAPLLYNSVGKEHAYLTTDLVEILIVLVVYPGLF